MSAAALIVLTFIAAILTHNISTLPAALAAESMSGDCKLQTIDCQSLALFHFPAAIASDLAYD